MILKTGHSLKDFPKSWKTTIENFSDKNPATEAKGWTPLHCAAKSGHLDVCKLIMDYLVDKNPKDKHGTTPLHFAAQKSHLEVCRLFLDNNTPIYM